MADILLQARKFQTPYDSLNGSSRIPVTRRDYVRAALTFGFQHGFEARQADRNLRRYRYLGALGAHGLLTNQAGDLCLNAVFKGLDASEQRVLTYWHGTILAKIVAARHLGIPWLVNVDEMRRQNRATISEETNERGDFVGRDGNLGWHAVEAKGRSNQVYQCTIDDAKRQVSRIESVDSAKPLTRSACVTDLSMKPVTVILEDPPGDTNAHKRIEIEDSNFWGYYYGNLAAYIERTRENVSVVGVSGFAFARVFSPFVASFFLPSDEELYIGLPVEILREPNSAPRFLRNPDSGERSPYVGSDQIALAGRMLDWTDEDQVQG